MTAEIMNVFSYFLWMSDIDQLLSCCINMVEYKTSGDKLI